MEHHLLMITDEVYEHLVFDRAQHLSIATFPGTAQYTLPVSGAGKTFSVTGWKIGWVCGPAHLVAAAGGPAVRAVTAGRPQMITTDDHYRYYAERSQRVV